MWVKCVIVDELPETCDRCDICREDSDGDDYCILIDDSLRWFDCKHKRHPECPLVPDMEDIVEKENKNE